MQADVAQQLLELNRQFYQTFALQFSQTRQRLQPGVRKLSGTWARAVRILDLGCGNGELARELLARGHTGGYVGLDVSAGLLEQARQRLGEAGWFSILEDKPSWKPNLYFIQADLSDPDWAIKLDAFLEGQNLPRQFDLILAFAVFHHLPGVALRSRIMKDVRRRLSPGGMFIHSNWQFLNSPRLAKRCQPWSRVGLGEAQLEPGDYLLDWRQGGEGLRYVHHFTESELMRLATDSGFNCVQSFLSDGEGGNLSIYQVWMQAILDNG